MKDTKVEFILFLDPTSRRFYSYCPSRGLIVEEENVPNRIMKEAEKQIDELHICMEDIENKELTSFQKRPIPLNLLTERTCTLTQANSNILCTSQNSICLLQHWRAIRYRRLDSCRVILFMTTSRRRSTWVNSSSSWNDPKRAFRQIS